MSRRTIRITLAAVFAVTPLLIVFARLNGLGYGPQSLDGSMSWEIRAHWKTEAGNNATRFEISVIPSSGLHLSQPSILANGRTVIENTGRIAANAYLNASDRSGTIELAFQAAEIGSGHSQSPADTGTVDSGSVDIRPAYLLLEPGSFTGDDLLFTRPEAGTPHVILRVMRDGRSYPEILDVRGTIERTNIAGSLAQRADEPLPFLNAYRWWVEMNRAGVPFNLIKLLLALPVGALLVVVARNIAGLETYGTFLPALIAASSVQSGLVPTLAAFLIVIVVIGGLYPVLRRLGLLHAPRMALLLTSVILLIIFAAGLGVQMEANVSLAGPMLPVVLVALTAERFARQWEDERPVDALRVMGMTLAVIVICHTVMSWNLLGLALLAFPELLLILLSAHILLGRFVGIRLTEYGRFRSLIDRRLPARTADVLGINRRNAELIETSNAPQHRILADDKLAAKEILLNSNIPVPPTLEVFSEIGELRSGVDGLMRHSELVLKPARGRAGGGILVLERGEEGWFTPSGRLITRDELLHHAADLLGGTSSFGSWDRVIVEHRVRPDDFCAELSPLGLADIRIIVHRDHAVQAMMRIPTSKSDGRANLHQGALGVAIDIETGELGAVHDGRRHRRHHPDTGVRISGRLLPDWARILQTALDSARVLPLGYVGVDIVLDEHLGPLVMELNVRPGLRIQAINGQGLRPLLREHRMPERSPDRGPGSAYRRARRIRRTWSAMFGRSSVRMRAVLRSMLLLLLASFVLAGQNALAQIESDIDIEAGWSQHDNVFHSPDSLFDGTRMMGPSSLLRSDGMRHLDLDAELERPFNRFTGGLRTDITVHRYDTFDRLNSHDLRAAVHSEFRTGPVHSFWQTTARTRAYVGTNVLGDELNQSFSFAETEADLRFDVEASDRVIFPARYERTWRRYNGDAGSDPLDFDEHRLEAGVELEFDNMWGLAEASVELHSRTRSYMYSRSRDESGGLDPANPLQRLAWRGATVGAEWSLLPDLEAGMKLEFEMRHDAFQDYFSYVRRAGEFDIGWSPAPRLELEGSIRARFIRYRERTNASGTDDQGARLLYRYVDVEGRISIELSRHLTLIVWAERKDRFTNVDDVRLSVRRPYSTTGMGGTLRIDL